MTQIWARDNVKLRANDNTTLYQGQEKIRKDLSPWCLNGVATLNRNTIQYQHGHLVAAVLTRAQLCICHLATAVLTRAQLCMCLTALFYLKGRK